MKRYAALVLLLLLPTVSEPADAQPPGSARAPRGGPPDGPGGPGGPGGRRDPFREMFGKPGPSSSAPHPGASGGPHGMGPGHHAGHGHFRHSAVARLVKALRAGEITRAEFEAKFKELKKTAKERRKAHHDEVRGRFDAAVLKAAPFKEEFRHHARRMAFLNRAQVVAQTELTGDKQKKTLARIDKLIELETQRHDKALEKLKGGEAATPAGSAVAATSAAPAASALKKETP